MKKIKLDTSNFTRQDIEKEVSILADLTLELHLIDLSVESMTAELEAQIKPLRDNCVAAYAPLQERRAMAQADYDRTHALVEAWATAQRPVLFAAKRSIEFLRGVIGFRLDSPSVDSLPKWTFTKTVQGLKGTRWGKQYLTWREPVLDKERILADRARLIAKGRLAAVGLTIAQEDRFYFEPKRETSDANKEAA